MNGSIFVDTNVLVYAYDRADPSKQKRARTVLAALTRNEVGVISTQVLAEFYVAVTRKISTPLTPAGTYDRIQNYLQSWTVLDMTGLIVLEAVRGVDVYQLSFWDAQIWAAARLHQVQVIFSEDFSSGAIIEGVEFVNPFDESFSLRDWTYDFTV